MQRIVTNLWFDTEAEDAAAFYCSVFPDSRITGRTHYGPGGPREPGAVMTVDFLLGGLPFTGINGGPQHRFSEAVSFLVPCADQAEVDHYWSRLTAGGEEGRCGWLQDRYGVSWQVVPDGLTEVLGDPDGGAAATARMLEMSKLDIGELRRAAGLAEDG